MRAILESPSYRMAEAIADFLESDAARASRLALEFMRADTCLRDRCIDSTVVVFGGTRIQSPENPVQTRKIRPIPIILVGSAHWRRVLDLDYLIEQGLLAEEERALASVVDTGAEAARAILHFHTGGDRS